MSEVKDPKIKLFGKTIDLLETTGEAAPAPSMEGGGDSSQCDAGDMDYTNQYPPCTADSMLEDWRFERDTEQESQKRSCQKLDYAIEDDHDQPLTLEELKDCNSTPLINEDAQAPSADEDTGPAKTLKTKDDQGEMSNSQEKTLKKPDKILPCPRCNSMDTKFCYFNNYNVNQPRHFCKNCQRYWTAGGMTRNVPIGAGRRKTKNAVSQFRHLTVQEALQSTRVELPNEIHHPSLNPKGNVLTFRSDTPHCESMASVLNIDDTIINRSRSRLHKPEELQSSASHGILANSEDHSCGTSASLNDVVSRNVCSEALLPNGHMFSQLPCYPGAPWPYPWNSVPWISPVSPPTFGAAAFPLPFCPTLPPYWGCAVPGTWNAPWVITPAASQNQTPPSSDPNSPTLGKHSRDDSNISKPVNGKVEGESSKDGDSQNNLWVPKTLRIDDMGEAAKISIWETLGINDRADSVSRRGLFRAFQCRSKDSEKPHVTGTSKLFQANPAALSRSLSFHESS